MIMRTQITIIMIPLFVVVFVIAIALNQVASTISSEDLIVKVLNDAEIYEYIYEDLIPKISDDVVDQEYEIKFDSGAASTVNILKLDDVELNSAGLTLFLNDVIPRDYVEDTVNESLAVTLAYIRGEEDSFVLDLGIQDRIREFPQATEMLFERTELSGELVNDVVVPNFRIFNTGVLEQAFGLGFDEDEVEEVAFLLFAPEWIETRAVGAIEELSHYFSGDSDDFVFVLRLEDRVIIAGEILKNKLRSDDVLYRLVFEHMVRPLLAQVYGLAGSVGFGITLTDDDVVTVLEAVAPREWVRSQSDGMIDELVAYLVSASDEINFRVELEERKASASFALTEMVVNQLRTVLMALPICRTPEELAQASADIASRTAPRCLAGGVESIDVVLESLTPILQSQVQNFVSSQVPDQLNYSQDFFESTIGGNFQFIKNLRVNIARGIEFSDEDLLDTIRVMGNNQTTQPAKNFVEFISDGVIITDVDVIGELNPAEQEQLSTVRDYISTALSLRWLVWLLIILPLMLMAYVAADKWSSRMKWAGAILALSAFVTYVGISVVWSTYISPQIVESLPTTAALGSSLEENFPRLASELNSDGPILKVERILEVWQESLKNQAVPWIFFGVILFAIGTGWPSPSGVKTEPAGPFAVSEDSVAPTDSPADADEPDTDEPVAEPENQNSVS